jgi:hypothetical protein
MNRRREARKGNVREIQLSIVRSSDPRVRAARAQAAEELGLGRGCHDGACVVNGPPPRGQQTNGGCRCADGGGRHKPGNQQAALALIAERAAELLAP